MKQRTHKLLSLLLVLVMALSLAVPAFAGEAEPPEKELRFVWLDWDNEGYCFASDDALKSDNAGDNQIGYDLSRGDALLFFIWNNKTNKRERYVVPQAGDNLVVEKMDKDSIAKGARQSQYYVHMHMTAFEDSELTSNGLSFPVYASLGDFGFYSAETPSAETILANEVEAAKLTGDALYFCTPYTGTGEAQDHDSVSKVEKDHGEDDGNAKCYDIEQVRDGLWKLTLNETGRIALEHWGGVGINLKFEVKQADGNTREDGRGIFVKGGDQAPQLFFVWADGEWDEATEQDVFYVSERPNGAGNGFQVHAGSDQIGMFGAIKDGEDAYTENGFNYAAFTPVDVNTLKPSDGLKVEPASGQARKGEKWGKYFVRVSVDENGKEYEITSGGYAITVNSGLPDIGVYTVPTASLDTWAGEYGYPYNPIYDNTYYIISTAADAKHGQHLTDAKLSTENLPEDCGNDLVALEKVSDSVYKLTITEMDQEEFHVELDLTWTDFMGSTNTEPNHYFGGFFAQRAIVASKTPLAEKADELYDLTDEVLDKLTSSVTMNAGEQEDVYLYVTMFDGRELKWRYVTDLAVIFPGFYHPSDEALTYTTDEQAPGKVTLSAGKAGSYEIIYGMESYDWENLKLYHADGTEYSQTERDEFMELPFTVADGVILMVNEDGTEITPFTEKFPGCTYEVKFLGINYFDFGRLTVNVEGPAKTFADVKESDWFYNEVNWAVRRGIAAGTGTDTFSPLDDCTHAHILTFLWRAGGEPKSDAKLPFTPKNAWAADALAWAYEKGMIGDQFDDNAKCTSADAVVYIWQAKGKPAAAYDGRFTDVAADASYAQAVAWAVDAGVTGGNGVGTFGPATVCSRARIVTFLYRAFSK